MTTTCQSSDSTHVITRVAWKAGTPTRAQQNAKLSISTPWTKTRPHTHKGHRPHPKKHTLPPPFHHQNKLLHIKKGEEVGIRPAYLIVPLWILGLRSADNPEMKNMGEWATSLCLGVPKRPCIELTRYCHSCPPA